MKKNRRQDTRRTAAVSEALVGNLALAKQEAQAALALANGRDVEAFSAIALALAGDSAQAARLAGILANASPKTRLYSPNTCP